MNAPLAALMVVSGVYLPRYYVGLGLSFVAVGAAISMVRAIDIFFDPLISLAMDRTNTAVGRYRPWLIVGAPIVMIAIRMLLAPQEAPTSAYLVLWLLVAFAGYSMVTLGVAAWTAVLSTSYHDRSRVYGWMQGLSAIGQVSILLLPPLLSHGHVVLGQAGSMPSIGWILIVTFPIALFICTVFTPERGAAVASRPRFSLKDMLSAVSRPAMRRIVVADLMMTLGPGAAAPLYVYFFHDGKGFDQPQINLMLVFTIGASVLGGPFWGRLARRLNKHRTVQLACVCYAACHAAVVAMPRGLFLPTLAAMSAVGFCSAAFLPLVRAMVADITDEVKLEQKQDLSSLIFSMVTTTQKIGGSITVLFVFPILAMVGYSGKDGAVNSARSVFGLEACYLLVPIIAVFIGGAMFVGYKLDPQRHAAVRAALDQRTDETSPDVGLEPRISALH
jgi:Na+/melibiose symporter-like transporter